MKNTHRGVLLLVILQVEASNFTKSNTLHGCFSRFLNCTNDTKSRKASQVKINLACEINSDSKLNQLNNDQDLVWDFHKKKCIVEENPNRFGGYFL